MKITGQNLSIQQVYDVAVNGEPVTLAVGPLAAVEACFNRVQTWGEQQYPIYGVNTGFGELIHCFIPAQYRTQLQQNLLRSHAAGYGEWFSESVTRAIMVVRLNSLIKGYSGVSVQVLELLQHCLNRKIHPIIPMQGSLGASGDLAPLAHLALALMGQGQVQFEGKLQEAATVFKAEHLKPLSLGYKEALALINGTSAMTGVGCLVIAKIDYLLKLAVLASADVVQCLQGSSSPFEAKGHALKNHRGQVVIARQMHQLLEGSRLVQNHDVIAGRLYQAWEQHQSAHREDTVFKSDIYLQSAYSLRCIPQILGPVLDTLQFCRQIVEAEVNSCNDNPLLFDTPEATFHGGNFHGQYVAMACDFLNIAVIEIGVLAERQLNRLLDPHLNGDLPPYLAAGQVGLQSGFEGAQYLATSLAAENLSLAAPSSVLSISSNGSNQDVVSMGLIAARKTLQLCENTATILATLVAACHQAYYFLDGAKFSPQVKTLHHQLATVAECYQDDVPIHALINQVRTFLLEGPGNSLVHGCVGFCSDSQGI